MNKEEILKYCLSLENTYKAKLSINKIKEEYYKKARLKIHKAINKYEKMC